MTTTEGDTVAAPLRVMVVDDHQTFADLLSLALSSEPDLQCIGTAGSAAEAVAMAAELRPDVVVMDIEMPRRTAWPPPGGSARSSRTWSSSW